MPRVQLHRRRLIQGAVAFGGLSAAGLAGCATRPGGASANSANALPIYDRVPPLAPVRARADRLFDITVCLRPFRAQGPRLDTEEIGRTLVVHNYGHGGSGWSLSWGSGTIAVKKAMAGSPRQVAVIGCGALGLTSAILAQDAGADVTIYARDLLPETRSARATGSWTPDSRIALTNAAGPQFGDLWEQMARTSFKHYRRYLGLPGDPVVWRDRYVCWDQNRDQKSAQAPDALDFANYDDRIRDLTPAQVMLPPGASPFPTQHVRRTSELTYNVADYSHLLMSDFLARGGRIERREFHSPSELVQLKEKVVINCPGFAARELWKDESVVPVRGQIGWLIPQPEVNYNLLYGGVNVVSRSDGIVVQVLTGGDMRGYGDANETVDRTESVDAVGTLADFYSRFGQPPAAA